MLLCVSAAFAQKAPLKFNQYGVAVQSDRLDVEAQDGILVLASPTLSNLSESMAESTTCIMTKSRPFIFFWHVAAFPAAIATTGWPTTA